MLYCYDNNHTVKQVVIIIISIQLKQKLTLVLDLIITYYK